MARDSGGTYSLPASGNPVVSGTTISSVWLNALTADIKTELTDSLSRTGKGAMLSQLKLIDGNNGLPAVTFATDPDTGFWLNGPGVVMLCQNAQSYGADSSTTFMQNPDETGITTTLTITEVQMPLYPGTYELDIFLRFASITGAGVSMRGDWDSVGAASIDLLQGEFYDSVTPANNKAFGAALLATTYTATSSAGPVTIRAKAFMVVTTAGTIVIKVASLTSGTVTLKAGSHIRAKRILAF